MACNPSTGTYSVVKPQAVRTAAYAVALTCSGNPTSGSDGIANSQAVPTAYGVALAAPDNAPRSSYGIANSQHGHVRTQAAGIYNQTSRPGANRVNHAVATPGAGHTAAYSEARQPRHRAQTPQSEYNQLAPANQRAIPKQQPGAYKALDPEAMTWASSRALAQSESSAAVRQVRVYDRLHNDDRTGNTILAVCAPDWMMSLLFLAIITDSFNVGLLEFDHGYLVQWHLTF